MLRLNCVILFQSTFEMLHISINRRLTEIVDNFVGNTFTLASKDVQGVSKNCSTFDKILKNKVNMNRLMER